MNDRDSDRESSEPWPWYLKVAGVALALLGLASILRNAFLP